MHFKSFQSRKRLVEKISDSYQVKLAHCTSEESNNKQCIKIGKESTCILKGLSNKHK